MRKKELLTILIIELTEVIGFSLILPFLPYFAESLGATPLTVGAIIATFAACQFISAPIIGKLSDKYGRKPLLIWSQVATFTGFLVLGFANTLALIFISRIIDGLLGSTFTVTRTYLSDLTKGKDRTKMFGYFGAVFSIGLFIGPAIGGFFSLISYSIPAFIAAGMTMLSIILTVLLLKETIKTDGNKKITNADLFPIKDLIKELKKNNLRRLLIEFFLFIIAFTMLTSSLALYVKHQLGFGPEEVAIALIMVGVFRLIFQILIMPRLLDKFSERQLRITGFITIMTSMLMLTLTVERTLFYIVMILFATGGGLIRPLITSEASRRSRSNERGRVMGVLESMASLSQIIGPLMGGFIIENYYPGYIGIIGALLVITALITELSCKAGNLKEEC